MMQADAGGSAQPFQRIACRIAAILPHDRHRLAAKRGADFGQGDKAASAFFPVQEDALPVEDQDRGQSGELGFL